MQLSDIPGFFGLQSNRLFTIQTPMKGRSDLVLVDFRGTEGLSQNFEFHVRLASQDSNIELKKLIGQPVTITLQLTDALASSEERYFHGYVANFSHLDHDGSFTVYSATIVPWLWMLSRSRDIRIFQEENTEAILSKVFREYGKIASFEFRLSKATKNRSYCTQYRETDLEFVERLMQEDGLFFYFEHAKDDHKLIITDNSVAAKPIGGRSPVLQYTKGEALDNLAVITTFQASRQLESTHVGLKTFDYKVPHARRYVSGGTEVDQGDVPSYEVYDYLGEHGFPDSDRGEALTRFRTQALAAHSKIFIGTSTSRRLSPCLYFELDDHYDHGSTQPEDRQFLLTTVTHSGTNNYQAGEGAATYQCSFTCIRKKIPYRPAFTIEQPSIIGPQTAVVVGPEGEEIYTDNLGRVKVQFHWDRLGKRDQGSSCWVRVGQPWAGRGFGMIQIPRIGDEVVVIFLDGNPDRPLIISSVYNSGNMPPWGLPANATQSGILTRSTKSGDSGTANALRFEDRKGQEEVWLHAEKDQRIEVENDESHSVGNDRRKTVDNDENAKIGRNWTLHTGGIKFETVDLASVQSVGLGKMLNVGLAYNVNVGGLYLRNVALQMASTVGLNRVDRVVQDWTSHVGHTYEVTVRGKAVGDAVKKDQESPLDISPDFSPQLPDPVKSADSNQIRITDTGKASLSGSSTAQLIGPGGTITIDAAGIHLKGKGIYLEGPVTQSGGSAKGLAPVTEADCAECAKKTTSAHPVDVATGQKLLTYDDFVLPGRIPIQWQRRYRSADQRVGSLGVAWKLQYATEVRRVTLAETAKLVYIDFDGRQLQFPILDVGQEHFHPIEKYTLVRLEDEGAQARYAVRFPSGIVETYAMHPQDTERWLLQRYETRDKQWLTFDYTPTGAFRAVSNNCHSVSCRHDDHGRITEVHLINGRGEPTERLAAYQYDEAGDLVEAIDSGNLAWRYQYHNHLLTRYETPAGAAFVAEWDGETPQAHCVRTYGVAFDKDDEPTMTRETRFTYHPVARSSQVSDAFGNTTTYHYNGLWAVDHVIYPDGSTMQVEFDEIGNVAAQIDALGRRTDTIRNANGSAIAIRDAAGSLTRIEYNDQNLPIRITDPAGQIWQREYDQDGHLVKAIDPLGNASSTAYENGLPISHTDALGNVTRMQFNDAGQVTERTDCSGFKTQYCYDNRGRLVGQTNAIGQTSQIVRNSGGQTTQVESPGLGAWKTEYDDIGQPIARIDPAGRMTRFEFDPYGQVVTIRNSDGRDINVEYDEIGRVKAIANAKGERTTFSYDALGRTTDQVGFDGRRRHASYNVVGEATELIDFGHDGQLRTTLLYDNRGLPIERRLGDGTVTTYVYDTRGLLVQLHHQADVDRSQITYEYDAAGRRTAEVQAHHGRVWRLQNQLDALGNRTEMLNAAVGALRWQRYGSGHVHGVLVNDEPLVNFERDALHRTVQSAQGPIAHLFAYTEAGQLQSHWLQDLDERGQPRAEPRQWRAWSYDATGQVVRLSDAWRGEHYFRYDPLARLIGATREAGAAVQDATNESYLYDTTGNMIARARTAEPFVIDAAFASAAEGDRLTRFTAIDHANGVQLDFAYDGHGNRIERSARAIPGTVNELPSTTRFGRLMSGRETAATPATPTTVEMRYRYDAGQQLTDIEYADGSHTKYRYDAIGRRIAKIHTPAGAKSRTELFVWDGDWLLHEIAKGATQSEDSVVTYVAHPDNGGPLVKLECGRRFHYMTDHLGAPQELYDDSRRVVWAAAFDSYGGTRTMIVEDVDNPIRFPGQFRDAESGLFYNRYRYYDPEVGRYVNQDPIGLAGGYNVYLYANGNPIGNVDPNGLNCTAANGMVTCNTPTGPINFPRPSGWPDTLDANTSNYHAYNVGVPLGGASADCVRKGIANKPTPGTPSPATAAGTLNNATPATAQSLFNMVDKISSFGNDSGGYNNSPVNSYVMNGGNAVVNVTMPGHPLFPGYVIRTVNGGMVSNYGEGAGILQGPLSQELGVAGQINGVWNGQTQGIIDECGCKNKR